MKILKCMKKPVVVEAIELTQDMMDGKDQLPPKTTVAEGFGFNVETPEGVMKAMVGDFHMTGVKGETYFIKRDIFLETYRLVI